MNMSNDTLRRSPVDFKTAPKEKVVRNGWEVVSTYEGEGPGPFLVDLCHLPKWDVQHKYLSQIHPSGLMFPEEPGTCRIESGLLLNRMNHYQAAVWQLRDSASIINPEPFFTDVTDGWCLLALVGMQSFSIVEKISSLDLAFPEKTAPFLIQGPVLHIPCQVVVLAKEPQNTTVILAFSRGYGQAMSEAILDAGHELGLHPGGETVFLEKIGSLCGQKRILEGGGHSVNG